MKFTAFYLLACLALPAVPCFAEPAVNGTLPPNEQGWAARLVGTYTGYLYYKSTWVNDPRARPRRWTGVFQTETVHLNFAVSRGSPAVVIPEDFIERECGSSVGPLLSWREGLMPGSLILSFSFDPGRCADKVQGRIITLWMFQSGHILAEVQQSRNRGIGRDVPMTYDRLFAGSFDR